MTFRQIRGFEEIYGAFKELKNNFYSFDGDLKKFSEKICNNGVCIVCETDKVCGVIAFYANDCENHKAYITAVLVDSSVRGHGIGAKLMQTAEDLCRADNFSSISLEVAKENISAQNLYKKLGYKEYDFSEKSLFMRKKLI